MVVIAVWAFSTRPSQTDPLFLSAFRHFLRYPMTPLEKLPQVDVRHVMEAQLVIVFFANCVKCMSYDDAPPDERENVLNSRLDVLLKLAVGIVS